MREPSTGRRKKANPRGAVDCTISGSGLHLSRVISAFVRGRWPRKTEAELRLRADIRERQAKALIGGDAAPSGETLASLITSDAGFALIAALMAALPEGERPEWWSRMQRQMALSDARRELEENRRRIERLEAEV